MSRPWMPLWIADYKKDTSHLAAHEHGAYLLLTMHYWATGGLPDDDKQLARIACMSPSQWRRARPIIVPFFHDGWKHKRIEIELAEADRQSAAGRTAGLASAEARRSKQRSVNDRSTTSQPSPSLSHLQEKQISNFQKVGDQKAKGWTPPKHGATSKTHGTVYVKKGTPEWDAYADDHRKALGSEPVADANEGYWFPIVGRQKPPEPLRLSRNQ